MDIAMKEKNLTFHDAKNLQIWRNKKQPKINNGWATGKLTEVLKQEGYHEKFQK
jgi:hypothetical protein